MGMGKMRTCGLADLRTGGRVNCGPTWSAFYPRELPVATARMPMGALATLQALGFTLFMSHSLPFSTAFSHCPVSHSLHFLFPSPRSF